MAQGGLKMAEPALTGARQRARQGARDLQRRRIAVLLSAVGLAAEIRI